jgi:DNA-directed RNA polymerase specialized sigma24 family protein
MATPHDNDATPPSRRIENAPRNDVDRRSRRAARAATNAHRGVGDAVPETVANTEGRRRSEADRRAGERPRGREIGAAAAPDWNNVLAAIGASFDWLCTRPHPVCVDGRAIPGLPDALISLDELRSRVIARGCPLPVSDAVWAHLASRSRTDGASWTVACAGMALPMLRRVVRTLTLRFAGDRADIAAETVAGFLAALAVIDVGGVALFASMRWAAYRAGLAAVHAALAAPVPLTDDSLTTLTAPTATPDDVDGEAETAGRERAGGWRGSFGSGPPPAVAGHPDLVLARAVADGILSLAEAALIGSTRLEALTIADAAQARGQSVGAVTVARHRAEHRLRRYLTSTPPNPSGPAPTARAAHAGAGSVRPETEPLAAEDSGAAAVSPSGRRRIRTRASRPHRRGWEAT